MRVWFSIVFSFSQMVLQIRVDDFYCYCQRGSNAWSRSCLSNMWAMEHQAGPKTLWAVVTLYYLRLVLLIS